MLDFLEPIGAITCAELSLEYGRVGGSNCVYLSLKGGEGVVPTVIYTPEELESLLAIVDVACGESSKLAEGSTLRLGILGPKPIALRLALVHPLSAPPFLLLRFYQACWKQDVRVAPQDLSRLLRMGRIQGAAPILGTLQGRADGSWDIGGRRLRLLEGLSPGSGFYGEYMHADEVSEEDELEVWTFLSEGEEFVASFRSRSRWKSPGRVSEPLGQRGDDFLSKGETHLARQCYRNLGEAQLESGSVTAIWAAKAALSALLCEVLDGDDQAGQAIWLGRSQDKFLQIGLKSLEAGQVDQKDELIFEMISAYFHSLNPESGPAEKAVNSIMPRLYKASLDRDPSFRRIVLSNWYLYLQEIFEGPPPEWALGSWKSALDDSELIVKPKALCFPSPEPWLLKSESKPSTLLGISLVGNPVVTKFAKILAAACCVLFLYSWSLGPTSKPSSPGKFELSLNGYTLGSDWTQMSKERSTRDYTFLRDREAGVSVRLDSKGEFEELYGGEIRWNDRIVLTSELGKDEVLEILGPPSKQLGGKPIYLYRYKDGGRLCLLEVNAAMGGVGFSLKNSEHSYTDVKLVDLVRRLRTKS